MVDAEVRDAPPAAGGQTGIIPADEYYDESSPELMGGHENHVPPEQNEGPNTAAAAHVVVAEENAPSLAERKKKVYKTWVFAFAAVSYIAVLIAIFTPWFKDNSNRYYWAYYEGIGCLLILPLSTALLITFAPWNAITAVLLFCELMCSFGLSEVFGIDQSHLIGQDLISCVGAYVATFSLIFNLLVIIVFFVCYCLLKTLPALAAVDLQLVTVQQEIAAEGLENNQPATVEMKDDCNAPKEERDFASGAASM